MVVVNPRGGGPVVVTPIGEQNVSIVVAPGVPVEVSPVQGPPGEMRPPGPRGPVGPSADAASGVTVVQQVPLAVRHITHALGYSPNVTIVDTSGEQVEGDVVYSPDLVTVTFSAAFAGTAYLS